MSALVAALAIAGAACGGEPSRGDQGANEAAWRSTYLERGLPVPPEGPRDGFWGARITPKMLDDQLGWHERENLVPGLLDVDARGFQRVRAADARYTVLVLGGSVAFGSYASSIETTWFHVLSTELARRGVPAELVIVAAGAWKAIQEVNALHLYGDEIAPDLVVMLDGLNDLTTGATAKTLFGERVEPADGSTWSREYHAHDYAARVRLYLGIIRGSATLARRLGCDLLVVLQPSLAERARRTPVEESLLLGSLRPHASLAALTDGYEAIRQGLRALERAGTIHFLDASRAFDGEATTTFTDLWHFSDPGHALLGRVMADAVAARLRER